MPPAPPPPAPDPAVLADRGERRASVAKIGDIAAAAGLRRIHVLAWRDLDDVEAGGSEVHISTVAQLWAEAGIEVTMRTSYAQGHPPVIQRDGYRVIRRAGRYLVFPRAAYAEMTRRTGPRDALVEIWNGMPFLSPLWDRGPKVVFLHHVHAEMWQMTLPPNLAALGSTLESRIAPLLYRRTRIITLSESSKQELVDDLSFDPARVTVVPPGIDPRFTTGGRRAARPLVVAVGRLVPVKRYDRLIRAAHQARQAGADLDLVIVGEGYERLALESLVEELDAAEWVSLPGRISEGELVRLYRRAWLVASASAREGWGMAITEAGACGTPAVATRVPGHLDAVVDGSSGLLAEDDAGLARAIEAVVTDAGLRRRLGAGALAHARRFTWAATATDILRALAEEADRSRPHRWFAPDRVGRDPDRPPGRGPGPSPG